MELAYLYANQLSNFKLLLHHDWLNFMQLQYSTFLGSTVETISCSKMR